MIQSNSHSLSTTSLNEKHTGFHCFRYLFCFLFLLFTILFPINDCFHIDFSLYSAIATHEINNPLISFLIMTSLTNHSIHYSLSTPLFLIDSLIPFVPLVINHYAKSSFLRGWNGLTSTDRYRLMKKSSLVKTFFHPTNHSFLSFFSFEDEFQKTYLVDGSVIR